MHALREPAAEATALGGHTHHTKAALPEDHAAAVFNAFKRLEPLEADQVTLASAMLRAYNSALYPLDLLAVGAINRSMAHCSGFRQMIEARNFICAASILRLQLDTALRFASAWLVPEPHALAHAVLKGTPVRILRDRDGKKLTDTYLVSVVAQKYPWITDVYEQTSGYIHLSEKHLFNAITAVTADRGGAFKMSPADAVVPDEFYVEAIDAFCEATTVFLQYLEGWVVTKANPELVAQLKNQRVTKSGASGV